MKKTEVLTSDPSRRDLFKLLFGGGVAATGLLHSTLLRALELPRGTKWREGISALRRSAIDDKVEFGATFVGTKEEGEWLATTRGASMFVDESNGEIARKVVDLANAESIRDGVAIYHTHPDATVRAVYGANPAFAHRPDILEFLSMPYQDDATALQHHMVKKYFELAGVSYGPLESGVVTSGGKWTMTEINWNDPVMQRTHRADFEAHNRRERLFAGTLEEVKKLLQANPEVVSEIYDTQLESTWNKVVDSAEKKLDLVAHAFLRREIALNKSPGLRALFASPAQRHLIRAIVEARQDHIASVTTEHMRDIVAPMIAGSMSFDDGVRMITELYRRMLGYELTWTPHP